MCCSVCNVVQGCAVCCRVLQYVAAVLQPETCIRLPTCNSSVFVAVNCSVLQCDAVCCSVLQCAAVCCSVLQCVAECDLHQIMNMQCYRVALRCSVLQCAAVCCSVTHCVAVCGSLL